ncbi:hypothetical protein [Tengunoibacter tsumagoiensis]|uniref:Single cache domain-containing protein n=1 Tax=Tengunoibacter tsumagoiensis TaxID=2014871 RepID=A0A401ZUX1_9CHLR|nr:hypothetical protein [Tengunoibacter tsumagoiensis]GCE10683.1 hypothetical protein KTT_05420 [Tengunoibacter tsumagoiensis]
MKVLVRNWIISTIIITGLCGLLYAVVQQELRQSANYPQVQLSEDIAAGLGQGKSGEELLATQFPGDKVEIATSIAPYAIIFDNAGKPVAASATLNGQLPAIPSGIFDDVRHNGEDRVTWQPQDGVRSALVVTQVKDNGGFVAAGRSLRESEDRTSDLGKLILAGWIALLFVTLVIEGILFRVLRLSNTN